MNTQLPIINNKAFKNVAAGFTLLELLVVITLLVIIAGFSLSAYEDVQDQAGHDAVIYEMAELRNALLQFRRDSGTNDFPRHGIYECTDIANGNPTDINPDIDSQLPTEAGGSDAAKIAWCQHPANFWMLFINPFDDVTTTAVEEGGWNPDTKRGWNGPYLQRKSGYVDMDKDLLMGGSGTLTSGAVIANLWGISSPFVTPPKSDIYLVWRQQITGDDLPKSGTPYLLFDLDSVDADNPARLVSLGQNHNYDGDGTSDCLPPATDSNGFPIDHVLCLLR